ncbi:MAG: ligand-binding sensor domain-containing protein, partial [Planctomycetota bacterium]
YAGNNQDSYKDHPYLQDFSEKIPLSSELTGTKLSSVCSDRNGRILVLSSKGLLQVQNSKLVPDRQNRPLLDMQIINMDTYRDQFVYLTDKVVLSNAWAGKLYVRHKMADVGLFEMGKSFDFLLSGENALTYLNQSKNIENLKMAQKNIKQLLFDRKRNRFLILSDNQLDCFQPEKKIKKVFEGRNLNCIELINDNMALLVGTKDGYIELDANTFNKKSALKKKLPCTDIRCIKQIGEKVWFGTSRGTFAEHSDGQTDYYVSKRWLLDDTVIDLAKGPNNSVLVLDRNGLSIIHFKMMTLQQKAKHFDKLTRKRHIRYGLNSALSLSRSGDLSTGTLIDTDNDGLWTSMYLAGELFRYDVTKSQEALQNCYEAFEAMERLTDINPLEGFPSRTFERTGYKLADKDRWRPAEDQIWDWKATTSSDEIVGHYFVYSIFAEVIPDQKWRNRSIHLMKIIMDHIIRNDWYLIDYDGKPTLWGKWHPDYVNQFPKQVGDRRLNSVEIIGFLQTTYHFTGKAIYKEKAYELMDKYGYLDNIMIPISHIGRVSGIDLTTEWNHSDDELAFLSYWNLYRYAFTDELREKYRRAIKEHWEIERPEKHALWNLIYAITGADEFDLDETIWSLKEFPLDMIGWSVQNSHRKDLKFLEPNFRNQTISKVLPPDERPMSKYNGNHFRLDGGEGGRREYSGDIYLLPYWLGRYLQK